MCTPNDSAILHAIFNPNAPFGDICEDEDHDTAEDKGLDSRFPPDVLEEALRLELSGVTAAECGDVKTAILKFGEAISLLPDWPSAYNNRAQALRLQGDVTGALQDLNHAVELSKGMGIAGRQALVQRGLILRLKGKDEEAREDFQKAAQLGSDFARQQLVLLNPYAALCNRMLRDMVQKLQESDIQD
ncbi:tetratricopeptide repeat protein 36 [Dendrobates tinctorius]|uniref:tetratricopeptide repeat protein 36 n=1 Tax=Dendrobates tinctorius TaxID=92724 RepID=UPI003CC92EF4